MTDDKKNKLTDNIEESEKTSERPQAKEAGKGEIFENKESVRKSLDNNKNKTAKKVKSKIKKNRIIAGMIILAIIAIILLVIFVSMVKNRHNSGPQMQIKQYIYHGFIFNQSQSLANQSQTIWSTEFKIGNNTYQADFYYDPLNLTNIKIPLDINSSILANRSHVYISLQANLTSKATIGALEIGKITGIRSSDSIYGIYGIPTNFTIMNNSESPEYMQITCQNASSSILVFELREGNNSIAYNNNCIIIKADSYISLLRESDRIAYALLNIMN